MNKVESIANFIEENWSNYEIVDAWNQRCESHNDYDAQIEYMDSFDDLFSGKTPSEIAEMVWNRDFRTDDDFFAFTAYGNIVSFNDPSDYGYFSFEELAEWIISNGDSTTADIDTDALIDDFINEYEYELDMDYDEAKKMIDRLSETEPLDFLMDDWDDIFTTIKEEMGGDE